MIRTYRKNERGLVHDHGEWQVYETANGGMIVSQWANGPIRFTDPEGFVGACDRAIEHTSLHTDAGNGVYVHERSQGYELGVDGGPMIRVSEDTLLEMADTVWGHWS